MLWGMKDSAFESLRAPRGGRTRRWLPAALLGTILLVGVGGRIVHGEDAAADRLWSAAQAPAGSVAPAGDPGTSATTQSATTAPASGPSVGSYTGWPSGGSGFGNGLKEDDGGLVWRLLGSVVVILVLAAPLVWLSRRLAPRLGTHVGKRLSLLETMYLGPRKSVHLVQVGSRRYLLGSSQEHVSLLAEVTSAFNETPAGEATP